MRPPRSLGSQGHPRNHYRPKGKHRRTTGEIERTMPEHRSFQHSGWRTPAPNGEPQRSRETTAGGRHRGGKTKGGEAGNGTHGTPRRIGAGNPSTRHIPLCSRRLQAMKQQLQVNPRSRRIPRRRQRRSPGRQHQRWQRHPARALLSTFIAAMVSGESAAGPFQGAVSGNHEKAGAASIASKAAAASRARTVEPQPLPTGLGP